MSGYVIVYFDNEEIDRLPLGDRLIIGRTAECTLCVRDVQLSRRHCAIEQSPDGFILSDLHSRNGTLVNGRVITRHILDDGDLVRMGRTRLTFRAGAVELPTHSLPGSRTRQRPLSPGESSAATLTAFEYKDPDTDVGQGTYPRPQPHRPAAYVDDEVQRMVEEIASSSWDSILAENSRPVVMETLPIPQVRSTKALPRKRRRDVDTSLQAHHEPRMDYVRLDFSEPRVARPSPEAILDDSIAALELSGYLGEEPISVPSRPDDDQLPDLAQALAEIEAYASVHPLPMARLAPLPPQPLQRSKRHLWLAAAMVWLAAAVVFFDSMA